MVKLQDITLVFNIQFPADLGPAFKYFHNEFVKIPEYKHFKMVKAEADFSILLFTINPSMDISNISSICQQVNNVVKMLCTSLFEQQYVFKPARVAESVNMPESESAEETENNDATE